MWPHKILWCSLKPNLKKNCVYHYTTSIVCIADLSDFSIYYFSVDQRVSGYTTFRSSRFGLSVSIWAVSIAGVFCSSLETFRSGNEILCSLFNANVLKSRKIKKKNYKHDPRSTVNQHEHMWFSLSASKLNHYLHFQLNTNTSNS